jgi:competence protein ComFC
VIAKGEFMAAVNVQRIDGNWTAGRALDLHTTASTYLGDDQDGKPQFENIYSELGALLHRLKYEGDQSAAPEIIATAANWLSSRARRFNLIIPVPASTPRAIQPVTVMAEGVGAAIDLPVISCVDTTRPTTQLKAITDPDERKKALSGLHTVNSLHTSGKNILLFDDLFRSGSTLNAITNVLMRQGRAKEVCVLTITRTRVKR